MSHPSTLANNRQNVLITGGAGFLGANLAQTLLKNSNVIAVDNFITSSERNIDDLLQNYHFEFIKADICEPLDLLSYPELKKFQLDVQGIQTIYNLACPTSPKDRGRLSLETLAANSAGIKNILEIARQYNAVFVHASSQSVYGEPRDNNPIPEKYYGYVNPVGERSAYNEGKRFAETYVSCYQEKFNLNAKIARIFTTYGPKMALNDDRFIPDFIIHALEGKDLTILGDETTRDSFCYVDDVIEGLIKLAESDIKTPLNLGHYEIYNLKAVAEKIIKLADSRSKIIFKKPESYFRKYNSYKEIEELKS